MIGELPEVFDLVFLALVPNKRLPCFTGESHEAPLSLANCDAKLLASALRVRLNPLVDRIISPRQLGLRRSVSILTPVLEMDIA